jgi:hypothetical protein
MPYLRPDPDRAETFVAPHDVLARLESEFEYVEGDREAAQDHIGDMIAHSSS